MTVEPKIAVLGAGMQGTTVALELARRGCRVDVFDRGEQPITRAGLQNEGKLHLGFVYGIDASLRTTHRLAAGALRFLPLIRRWAGAGAEHVRVSSPFLYAVPMDSMLSPDAVQEHFSRVEQCVLQTVKRLQGEPGGWDYPGVCAEPLFHPLSISERNRYFSQESVAAAFATREVAVDPVSVAAVLRPVLEKDARVRFFPRTQVESVEAHGNRYSVVTRSGTSQAKHGYDHVVNALWDGRLRIDRGMGLSPRRDWLWRYKVGPRFALPDDSPGTASVTFMLGPYGDSVRYHARAAYLSWYPAGMIGRSSDLTPPRAWTEWDPNGVKDVVTETVDSLSRLYPEIAVLRRAASRLDIVGGAIFAWGKTDIDDPASELHNRYDIGVMSVGGYHTVDTGKYTMAPTLAMDVADRIAPDQGSTLT